MIAVCRLHWPRGAALGIALILVACTCSTPATTSHQAATEGTLPSDLLPNGREISEGILVGGQPTPEQLADARKLGYKTVINLRTEGERGSLGRQETERLGLRYVAIPVAGSEGVTEENARRLARALKDAEYPVIVHCASGNRVGAIFAMKSYYVDDIDAEKALTIGKAAGLTRLEPVVRQRLGLREKGLSAD